MSFWERNRGLLVGAIAAAAVAGVVHLALAGARRAAAQELERKNAALGAEIARLTALKNRPAPEVMAELRKERVDLEKVIAGLGGWLMVQPKEYQLPRNEPNPQLYFEARLNELRKRCQDQGGRYAGRPCPLGFTEEIQKEEVPLLLQRLSAARVLAEAADAARLAQVQAIVQGRTSLLTCPGVAKFHLRMLPLSMRFLADERQLVAFLAEIGQERRALPLQTLNVEVTDPKAKTFVVNVELLALVPRTEPPPPKKPEGPGPGTRPGPPVGRW